MRAKTDYDGWWQVVLQVDDVPSGLPVLINGLEAAMRLVWGEAHKARDDMRYLIRIPGNPTVYAELRGVHPRRR